MSAMTHLLPEFEAWKKRYPAGFESSLTLPCLRRIQEERGYIADSDIAFLVEALGVPRIQIEEVLSFYTQFRRKPIGRWHLQFCHNVSCSMNGAERILELKLNAEEQAMMDKSVKAVADLVATLK